MFDRNDLHAAVEAGALDAASAERFEQFMAGKYGSDAAGDPESLRFLANFNDIFITIGLVLLISGILAFAGATVVDVDSEPTAWMIVATLLPGAAAAWALSEYFCARRRLLLPSIVLCTLFCLFCGLMAASLYGENAIGSIEHVTGAFRSVGNLGLIGAGMTAIAAAGYFARFRLPFSLFILALALAAMAYAGVAFFGETRLVIGGTLALLVGLATLALAIFLDSSDPSRASKRSDYAFWLHLAAAPQVIFGLRGMTLGFFGQHESTGSASILLIALLGFAFVSLALNRRALIVSSLLTYGLALGALIEGMGLNLLNTTIFTLLLVGGAVVLIGGGWSTARRVVLNVLPRGGLFARIFPPEPAGFARA